MGNEQGNACFETVVMILFYLSQIQLIFQVGHDSNAKAASKLVVVVRGVWRELWSGILRARQDGELTLSPTQFQKSKPFCDLEQCFWLVQVSVPETGSYVM